MQKWPHFMSMLAQKVSEGIAPTLGARKGWVVRTTLLPLYPRERPGTCCIEGWVGLFAGLSWHGRSRSLLTRFRSPDCPARRESLYRLNYPGLRLPFNLRSIFVPVERT
jgi:hypothetical protein